MFSRKYLNSRSILVITFIFCFSELSWSEPVTRNLQTFSNEGFNIDKKLNIDIRNLPACQIGDLDLIRRELLASNEPAHLVLTIEALAPKSTIKPVSAKLPRGGDGKVSLTLDENMKDQALGLFLCKVTDGLPLTCANKKSISFNEMYKPYKELFDKYGARPESYQVEKTIVTDKIYYFTPVFLDSTGLVSFSDRPSEETFKELKEKFSFKKDEFESLKNRDLTLKSFPPLYENDRIVIRLPSYSPEKCLKQ